MGKKVVIGEGQINLIKEYLDKEYGIPLYHYLQKGSKVHHDANGMIGDGKELVPFFFYYMLKKADTGEWRTFCKFISGNQKLSQHFQPTTSGWDRDITVDGNRQLNSYVKANAGALYRIFAFTSPVSDIWENFYRWYKKDSYPQQIGQYGNLDTTTVLYNPRVAKTRWLIHFTPKEENAFDIVQNGFKRGIQKSQMGKMAFTNDGSIEDADKENGVYSYAYDVEDILNDDFVDKYKELGYDEKPFKTNFDMKTWSNAIHYAIMFQAPGVKVSHMTDRDEQVIFNNRMAHNFLMLKFCWQPWEENPKDPKIKKVNLGGNDKVDIWWEVIDKQGKPLYRNSSITEVIRWVVTNYQQYRKVLNEGQWESADIGEIECTLNFDEDEYFEWLQDNGVENSDAAKKQYIEEYCDYDVELKDSETYHTFQYETMTLADIEENFGGVIANDVYNQCLDLRSHRFEPAAYAEEVDLTNPNAVNQAAVKYLKSGEYTRDCRGFILTNGVIVYTPTEHNECTKIPGVKGTFDFIRMGNIRILYQSIDIAVRPTPAQKEVLEHILDVNYGKPMYVELMNPQIGLSAKKYNYVETDEVLRDIYNYFNNGIKQRQNFFESASLAVPTTIQQLENKFGMSLSENGKKWFVGTIMNGSPVGVSMDDILTKAVFLMTGVKPFPIGQQLSNEWDELDGTLRIIIKKTGYGQDILERFRKLKQNVDFITPEEMGELKKRLEYYPYIWQEFERCYHLFTVDAPAIYKAVKYLKNYKNGVPALEFCYLVGCIKEKARAATNVAVGKALEMSKIDIPRIGSLNEDITLYHGTNADFDKFDTAYLLSGWGEMAHGYGFYLTELPESAGEYAKNGRIMKVQVPDGKYLDNEYISPSEALKIAKKFYSYYLSTEYGKMAYQGMEKEFWDQECSCLAKCPDGEYIYGTISSFLGDDKSASEWLHSIGYVGMKLHCENRANGSTFLNYVIFSPENIKIVDKNIPR